MSRVLIKFCIYLAVMVFWISWAQALETVILNQNAELDFTPQEAYFLVDFGRGIYRKYDGVLVEPFQEAVSPSQPGLWHFCAAVKVPSEIKEVSFSVFIIGKHNRRDYIPPILWGEAQLEAYSGTTDDLRAHLLQRKKVLRSWEVELKTQQKSLKRLRADSDIIGNGKKLGEISDRIEQANYAVSSLETDISNLKEFLKGASSGEQPKGFYKRQRTLTAQLAELAAAARQAESGETLRRSNSELEVQQRLASVQMTRMDDYDALRAELLRIRRMRLKLEKHHADSTGRPLDEYQVPGTD